MAFSWSDLNPLEWIPLTDGKSIHTLQKESDAIDSARQAELDREMNKGAITAVQYADAQRAYNQDKIDVASQVFDEAVVGAKEGLKAEQNMVKGTVDGVINSGLGFVPTWGWIAIVVAIFWYLGGFKAFSGILAKK